MSIEYSNVPPHIKAAVADALRNQARKKTMSDSETNVHESVGVTAGETEQGIPVVGLLLKKDDPVDDDDFEEIYFTVAAAKALIVDLNDAIEAATNDVEWPRAIESGKNRRGLMRVRFPLSPIVWEVNCTEQGAVDMDAAQATRILIDVATRKRSHARQTVGEAVAVMEATLNPTGKVTNPTGKAANPTGKVKKRGV